MACPHGHIGSFAQDVLFLTRSTTHDARFAGTLGPDRSDLSLVRRLYLYTVVSYGTFCDRMISVQPAAVRRELWAYSLLSTPL